MKVTIIGGGPGGMYFAILAKKAWPDWKIAIYERNRPDDTFGFGVVFSDETLGFLRDYDQPSYEAIRRSFAYWDDINVNFKDRVMTSSGNGFCGCSRLTLLQLLQARCRELGIDVHFQHEVASLESFADSDLIVAADGINSFIREQNKQHFGTELNLRRNYFCWLGSSREMDAFNYFFRQSEHGIFIAHAYQYEPGMSTWIIELPPETWQAHGFGEMLEQDYIRIIERVFAQDLMGHQMINNRSVWRRFPAITNRTWVMDNIVLIGDAQHTAHFSIGSGTKLAMESSIALFESFKKHPSVNEALQAFDVDRRDEVERIQHAANVSLTWFENIADHWDLAPEQFAFQLMSRSKQITYDNLCLRDASFVDQCNKWFATSIRAQGYAFDDRTPAMFAPFRLRDLELANRVAMSPMAQYSANDGVPNEWHYVHYTSHAIGGAGLICTEMTCPSATARITPGCAGIWNREQTEAWQRIVAFVHEHSRAKICMQIGHAGRKGSTRRAWEGMDLPLPDGNWPIYSASPIKYNDQSDTPIEIDRAMMDQVRNEFVTAASNADAAGFDMIELHMAHGYLLASFISPLTNQRNDEYGGPIENRMKYPLEVFTAVRTVWPERKPMSVRISASDWYKGGLSEADLIAACELLKAAGVDLINVSTGQTVSFEEPIYGRMFQVPFADKIRSRVHIPTMVAGNIFNSDQINTVVLSGRADLVALARPSLTDPYFTLRAAAKYGYEDQYWPAPYLSGKAQAHMLVQREQEELQDMRVALKPPSHEIRDDEAVTDYAGLPRGSGVRRIA